AAGGGAARYDVVLEEARLVRQVFAWVGQERLTLAEVCRRLRRQGGPTRAGKGPGGPAPVAGLLNNPARQGAAQFGRGGGVERRPRLRPRRGAAAVPRRCRGRRVRRPTTPAKRSRSRCRRWSAPSGSRRRRGSWPRTGRGRGRGRRGRATCCKGCWCAAAVATPSADNRATGRGPRAAATPTTAAAAACASRR